MSKNKKRKNNRNNNTAKKNAAPKKQNNKNLYIIAAVVAVLAIIVCVVVFGGSDDNTGDLTSGDVNTTTGTGGNTNADDTSNDADSTPAVTANYIAAITVENYGTITVELDGAAAPITVANFVKLAKDGFYDGLTIHRIMEGFMMQGGCPLGNGQGGSDEDIKGEFSANGVQNDLSHTRGAISMARAADFNSASSQFFIVHENSTFLDGQYAAFGYVTEGMDVVDAICESAEPIDDNGTIPKNAQPVITSVVITEAP